MHDKIYCFYHRADFDGMCSAAVAMSFYGPSRLILMPWDYGESFPFEEVQLSSPMVVMDLIFPYDDFERLIKERKEHNAPPLIWIDHHKSAIDFIKEKGLDQDIKGLWRVGSAACELAWEYFFKQVPMPEAVHLLGRYDVWDHYKKEVLYFQHGMRGIPADPNKQEDYQKVWKVLLEDNATAKELVVDLMRIGKMKYDATVAYNARFAADAAFETEFAGYPVIAMNRLYTNSLAFDSVYDSDKHKMMVAFGWRKGEWKVSLYTDHEDIDCSQLAKERGGGGHKQAAGFQAEKLPFELGS